MTVSKSGSVGVVSSRLFYQGEGSLPSVYFRSVSAMGFMSCCTGSVPLLLVNILTSLPLTLSRPRIAVTSSSAIVVPCVGVSGGLPGALYVGNRQMFRAVHYKEKPLSKRKWIHQRKRVNIDKHYREEQKHSICISYNKTSRQTSLSGRQATY